MAKSIRSKHIKKMRREMRSTVGAAHATKLLRHATRGILKTMLKNKSEIAVGDEKEKQDTAVLSMYDESSRVAKLKEILSGVGGANKAQITLEPIKRKKLRYTFNFDYRKSRQDNDLEDETDDEATNEAIKKLEEEEEEENDEEGVESSKNDAIDKEDEVIQAAVTKGAGKPLNKLNMTSRHGEWKQRDLAQPNLAAGMYESQASNGGINPSKARYMERKKAKAKANNLRKKGIKKGTIIVNEGGDDIKMR
jgi:hypothetical protein